MKRLWIVFVSLMLLCSAGIAEEGDTVFPVSAWTTREVDMYEQPQADAAHFGNMAKGCWVTWLDTQGEWAYIDAQGTKCYAPVDSLTLDRVFNFDGLPTNSEDWVYEGEVRISPDDRVSITIWLKEEYADGLIFGGAELCCFEVVDEITGELICTAEPDLSSDPVIYSGEGFYAQGTALCVVPVLRHDGYSVKVQW